MKQILFSILFTISSLSLVAQFEDNFSDGDFSNNPTWEGDVNNFIINADGELQLNASDGGLSSLYTETEIPDSVVWEMFLNMDFAPSGSNQLRIYLQSSTIDLPNTNGYFLEIGETGNDDAILFYRVDNGSETLLAIGTLGAVADDPNLNLKVTRNAIGEWNIFTSYNGGLVFNLEGNVTDATYQGGDYFFSLVCKYTSTRTDKFFFDNIKIASLIPDAIPPTVVEVIPLSFTEIEVVFDEVVDEASANEVSNYLIDGNIGSPQNVELDLIEPNKVFLTLNNALTNNTSYNLQVKNVKDKNENVMTEQSLPFNLLVPEPIAPNDIIINEILFNPLTGGKDFVEIYNASNKILNLGELYIGNISLFDVKESDIENDYLMMPGEYIVFTEDRDDILEKYTVENEAALIDNDLPSFNDKDGNVSIFYKDGDNRIMIDSFDYNENFHFALLDDEDGVSLERINSNTSSQTASNWHSAASTVGFATPTYENSQLRSTQNNSEIFSIPETVFSPDQDGFQDLLLIEYQVENQGYLATVKIYDAKGRLVRQLFSNELLAQQGTLTWDGLTDDGLKARIGIYVILAEIFNLNGDTQQFKKSCVLAGRLD